MMIHPMRTRVHYKPSIMNMTALAHNVSLGFSIIPVGIDQMTVSTVLCSENGSMYGSCINNTQMFFRNKIRHGKDYTIPRE